MKSVRVKVKTGGWIQRRNRLAGVATVVISESHGNAAILYVLDKRDRVIGDALSIPAEAMDILAERWLLNHKDGKGNPGVCPMCGEGLEYTDDPEHFDDRTARKVKCSSCKFEGFEWAEYSFVGYTDVDDNDVP